MVHYYDRIAMAMCRRKRREILKKIAVYIMRLGLGIIYWFMKLIFWGRSNFAKNDSS